MPTTPSWARPAGFPAEKVYSLANTSLDWVYWQGDIASGKVVCIPAEGWIAPGASMNVMICPAAAMATAAPGTYSDQVTLDFDPRLVGDVTGDGNVDVEDLLTLVPAFGTQAGDSGLRPYLRLQRRRLRGCRRPAGPGRHLRHDLRQPGSVARAGRARLQRTWLLLRAGRTPCITTRETQDAMGEARPWHLSFRQPPVLPETPHDARDADERQPRHALDPQRAAPDRHVPALILK